jgi:hypothetical protein
MMTNEQQRAFFETFGYLHLRGAVAADIGWIIQDFHAAWAAAGIAHEGAKSTGYPGIMISGTTRLSMLLEHPAVAGALDLLLGDGWSCDGGDGNFLYGDSGWHSDVQEGTMADKGVARHIKVAFYLDALRRDSGCLRVIPGSHLGEDAYARQLHSGLCGGGNPLHLPGPLVPGIALESDPGDLVLFDHRIKHASFGGGKARRMFAINVFAPCPSEREREAVRAVMRKYRDHEKVDWLSRKGWRDWIDTLPAPAQRRFATTLALGAEVMAERAAVPA